MNELILRKNINDIIIQIQLKKIENDEQYRFTGEWLKRVKETEKMVDGYFEPLRKKAYATYKEILDKAKEIKEPLIKVESVVKKMRTDYKLKRKAEAQAEKERLLKMVDESKRAELEKIIPDDIEEVDGISHVEKYIFEITDVDKIPRKYMIPDKKKIQKVVDAMGEATNIPGIKVKKTLIERVRT